MKIFSSKKRVAAIGALTAATLVGGGMAVAYWTTTGSGTGTATAGTTDLDWSVLVDTTDLKNLAPTTLGGDPSQTVGYKITNIGEGQQYLTKAVISIDSVTPGSIGGIPACSVADFAINSNLGDDLPVEQAFGENLASGAERTGSVVLRLIDNDDNQDNCKNATVTLKVDAS
jgi:hypothetical protein